MTSQKKAVMDNVVEVNTLKGLLVFEKSFKSDESSKEGIDQFICLGCGFVEERRFQIKKVEKPQFNVGFGFFQDGKKITFCCFCRKCRDIFN
jgi:hypothetical protein